MDEGEELEIPTAYCPNCKDTGPVIVEEIDAVWCVYCPGCQLVINLDNDISVKWYVASELHKATGWRLDDKQDTQ